MSIDENLLLIKQEFADKIIIDENIENQSKGNRGIYGLFIRRTETEECVYIGRSEIISSRIVSHLYKIIGGKHVIAKLNKAFLEDGSIIICKFVEPVKYKFDDYYKDAQRLASRECYWIDYYQEREQCLGQVPEGRRPNKKWWDEEKLKRDLQKIGGSIKGE